jgi:hypothetical protein
VVEELRDFLKFFAIFGANSTHSSSYTKANTALNGGGRTQSSAFSFQSHPQSASISKAMRMAGVTSVELLTAHEDADSDADDDNDKSGGHDDDDHQPAAKPAANVPPALARRRSSVAAQNALIRSFNSKMSASGSSASSASTGSGLAGASGTLAGCRQENPGESD